MKTDKKSAYVIASMLLAVIFTLGGCFKMRFYPVKSGEIEEDTVIIPETDYVPEIYTPAPLVYDKDGQAFIACGAKTVNLGQSEQLMNYGIFNAVLSGDNRYLFFMKYNEQQSAGTLMKIPADASAAPAIAAEGVCAAQVSGDGSKVLYISGIADTAGDLYLKDAGTAPELIAKNVLPVHYGFSPKGGCIYYFVQEDSDTLALYIKKSGEEPSLVTRREEKPYLNYGVCVDSIGSIAADEEGGLLYTFYSDIQGEEIYLYSDGNNETITKSGEVVKTFGSPDELVYYDYRRGPEIDAGLDTSLWYKAPGLKAEKLADNCFAVFGGEDPYIEAGINGDENDRRFLIIEYAGYGYMDTSAALYEQELGKEKAAIAETDGSYVKFSPAANCAVYSRDGKSYIARKSENGWVETELCASQGLLINSCFDLSGKYFYYFDLGGYSGGILCRYSVADGRTEQLSEIVDLIYMLGDTPYASSQNRVFYRMDDAGAVKIAENAESIRETAGGVYFESYDYDISDDNDSYQMDVEFLADGLDTARSLFTGAQELYLYSIEYYPPIEKDPYRAIGVLVNEAYYYNAQLNGEENGYESEITLEKAVELSGIFIGQADTDEYCSSILALLNEGFKNYKLWQNEAAGDKKELYRLKALLSFGGAIDNYESDDECSG